MAGLNEFVKAPAMQGEAPDAPMQDAPQPAGNEATPEEQAMYTQFVRNGLEMIEATADNVAQSLSASGNPVLDLAMTGVSIISGLMASAKQAGQNIPGEIVFAAGAEILEALVEEAEALKIHDYSEEDMERAMFLAADMYREQAKATGMLDEEALKADYAMLEQAEQEGRLDEVLPGARERAEQIAAQQPQPEQPEMEEDV